MGGQAILSVQDIQEIKNLIENFYLEEESAIDRAKSVIDEVLNLPTTRSYANSSQVNGENVEALRRIYDLLGKYKSTIKSLESSTKERLNQQERIMEGSN